MESFRAAAERSVPSPTRPPGRTTWFRTRVLAVAGVLLAVTAAFPTAPVHAEPEPTTKELTTQAEKLADQLEQMTEQYNGLKVRLQQAQRAAKVAADNAKRQEVALQSVREKVGSLAATSYMQGGVDPTVAFVTSQDPQVMLDQAATLRYFATQDGTKVQGLVAAMQAAQRARKAAEDRSTQVEALRKEIDGKRKKVTDLYEKIRGKIVKKDPSAIAKLPVIGTGKAAEALRYAMTKLGRPYVWGADGPTSFDCSGLTMWAYKQVGINLPHYTGSQWNAGTHISKGDLEAGDLVFFHSDLHHMGMYIGGGKMIHAPHTGDVVRIAPIEGRPYAGAVRVA